LPRKKLPRRIRPEEISATEGIIYPEGEEPLDFTEDIPESIPSPDPDNGVFIEGNRGRVNLGDLVGNKTRKPVAGRGISRGEARTNLDKLRERVKSSRGKSEDVGS
jgi:hypothetical protein